MRHHLIILHACIIHTYTLTQPSHLHTSAHPHSQTYSLYKCIVCVYVCVYTTPIHLCFGSVADRLGKGVTLIVGVAYH